MPVDNAAQTGSTKIELKMKRTSRFFSSRPVINTLLTKSTSSTTMPTKHRELTTRRSRFPVECTAKKMTKSTAHMTPHL